MSESSTWICPECEAETEWNMKDVSDKGTPVCSKCDCDMQLKEDIENEEPEEEPSSQELMDIFIEDNNLRFEGESAVESLNKITNQLGYREESYRNGTSLEEFLKDNPGCCQAIIQWIIENMDMISKWKEGFMIKDE